MEHRPIVGEKTEGVKQPVGHAGPRQDDTGRKEEQIRLATKSTGGEQTLRFDNQPWGYTLHGADATTRRAGSPACVPVVARPASDGLGQVVAQRSEEAVGRV